VTISSGLTTTTGNFAQLLDGVAGVTAVTFSASPAQAIQNANVYLFTFTRAVKLDALYLKFNTLTQFGGTTKIQGSNTNNGSDWVDLSAAIGNATGPNVTANGAVSITNSMKYPVTLNTTVAYKYIRITGVAATNIVAQNASEVYFDFKNSAYVGSLYPKASCNVDTDSDGILNHFDRDSDGDTAPDAFESGATSNTAANYSFPNIDSNSDGLVDAVDPDGDGIPNYTSTYNPNAINNQISPFLTEICNDGIDNDGDGYVDMYDSDCNPAAVCASTKTVSNFQVQQQTCTSTGSYSNYQTPMVADIDRDGIPDLITFNDTGNSITVLNSTTLLPKFSIPNPDGTFGSRPNSLAVGQLDGSGYLEIAYVSSNTKLVVLRYNGTTWQSFISGTINSSVLSSGSYGSSGTAIADFDEDGTPEIYIGNQIFSVNFACGTSPCITNAINAMTVGAAVGNTGAAGGSFSYAYDVLPTSECSLCKGLEIVAGNQVYAVDVASGQVQLVRNYTGAPGANYDGPTAIADINLDGLLDVVVSNVNGSLYAWTPMTNQTVMSWTGGTGVQRPVPFIANVYNDDLADDGLINGSKVNYPEIIVLVGSTLTAYNVSGSAPIFTTPTSDTSAATSMVAFDFNGDGNKEIVYRDQTDLRIMYGGPMAYAPAGVGADRNYATFSCTSGTGWEHPVVADIDADGEAEIVGSCGTSICIFGSANFPWMPARPIWNQLSYNNVNVNDDGSIPVRQQNILASFNGANNQILNTFNTQLNPLELISPPGKIAAPDISVSGATITNLDPNGAANCSNLQIQYQIANTGSATMAKNIYVYVYDKDPRTQANASLIYQTVTNQNIPRNTSITQNLNFGIPSTSLPINKLYIAVNTNPYMTVLIDESDFTGSYPECSYTDNIFEFAFPGCSDIDGDGIIDLVDIDDDNDGIVDAVESPACFYTATEAMVALKVSTGLISSTVNSVSVTATDDIPTMRDNVSTTVAASNHVIAANQLGDTSKVIYKVQYPTAVSFTQMLVSTATANWGAGAFAVLEGSHDDVVYDAVSAPVSIAAGTPKVWPVTLNVNNLYRYYRIRLSTVGTTQPTFTNFEVTGTINPATYIPSANPKPINCTVDTDGDGILNHQDLDSDGDGCPDALEAGVSVNAGAFSSMSASGGSIYTGGIPSGTANAYVGNGTPSQYGANGFFNGIETALDSGIYNGTYTYSLYALSLGQNVCTDTDGDNVPDIFDIDDDNDGVLDKIECPTLFTNMATGGGFSAESATLPNWYVGLASATFPIAEPFTPSVINISNNGNVYNYGIGGGNQVNSQLTGGLFDSLDGSNTATGVQYVLQEGDPQHPIVNKLSTPLVAGVPYNYSFDLGNRASGSATKYIVMLYNADTKMAEKIITSGALNTIPAVGATPSYKNFTGSFIPASSANYYLLFYPSVSGNTESDFVIDRVAVAGAGAGACDIDNDGIPNYLDLDSDGDGCPDTKEAILYNHATEASIAGDVKNGSGGVVTSTVNTPNAMVPGPYGNNGFADALQSASNPDAYKYVYTYLFVATDANVSTCDNKFLYDIDSDDDGIPDAVESPSCFYTEAQAMDITEGVTSDFGWTIANPLSKTYDDITLATNYGEISAPTATSIQNKALITFDLPVIDAAFINSITLNVGLSFGAGKWKLQGLNMMTNVWTDLSAAAGQALGAGTIVFNNTLQNNTRYHSYRIIGVDNINIANAARLIEFSIQYKNYNASYHRTKMGCSSDADGDGVPNYIDRDSDGDGCPDAVEAGIPLSKLVPGDFFNTGGTVSGAHVTVGGNYGDNGLGDDVETAPDSGIVNYTSTYTQYATNKTLNFCTDTDGDSVPDLIDLDDDNDGILDTAECTYPALPTTTSTADIFAIWSNTTTAAGTNGAPTYLTSVSSWTAGAGLTAAISGGVINISNVNGSTLGDAFGANEYLEHPFTTTADNYNSLYYIRSSASNATNYHWAMLISDDNFVTYTILNIDMLRNATGVAINDINDYQLKPSTAYKVRTYYWGAPAFTFDEFTMFGYSECDTDSDGVPNRLDLDSDGDGCPDAKESGVAANSGATASMSSSGGSIYTGGIASGTAEAYVGNGTPAQYGNNGFFNGIETAAESGLYNGTYTYASAINATISACFCYKTPAAGTGLDTHHGITSLQRAGTDNSGWPMVRKGAWTALESKTKAFVPNRLTITEINSIPAANLKEGMMVYNITSNCIYINTDGTATGWKCFNTQACP
jgi:hypothetical protein